MNDTAFFSDIRTIVVELARDKFRGREREPLSRQSCEALDRLTNGRGSGTAEEISRWEEEASGVVREPSEDDVADWMEALDCTKSQARAAIAFPASRRPPAAWMPGVEELEKLIREAWDKSYGVAGFVAVAVRDVAAAVHSATSAPQPAGGVPQELLARLPNAHLVNQMRRHFTDKIGGNECEALADLMEWARSQPAAPPVAEWQKRAKDINERLPDANDMTFFSEDGRAYYNRFNKEDRAAMRDAAALCRNIAGSMG